MTTMAAIDRLVHHSVIVKLNVSQFYSRRRLRRIWIRPQIQARALTRKTKGCRFAAKIEGEFFKACRRSIVRWGFKDRPGAKQPATPPPALSPSR